MLISSHQTEKDSFKMQFDRSQAEIERASKQQVLTDIVFLYCVQSINHHFILKFSSFSNIRISVKFIVNILISFFKFNSSPGFTFREIIYIYLFISFFRSLQVTRSSNLSEKIFS